VTDSCDFEIQSIKNKLGNSPNPIFRNDTKEFSSEYPFKSAVLIPIVSLLAEINLLYTLRSASLDRHSGQVSFPGGIMEKSDNSLLETALRETQEEIGIERHEIQVIGRLDPLKTYREGLIYPFIGIINSLSNLKRSELEVEKIFYIPLKWLCEPSHSKLKDFAGNDGSIRKVWFFDDYQGELLWGISAQLTHYFIEIIKK
jgi:8-oxo-dGTP pyrophosphatase MutT (NUDIX family)